MFTVIICSSKFICNTKNNYSHIIEMISKNDECALCIWNTEANTFEESLPDLPKIISGKAQWRAVVVQDALTFGMECIDKRNPFDAVGTVKVIQDFRENYIFEKLDELLTLEQVNKKEIQEQWNELDEMISETNRFIQEHRVKKKENYSSAVCNPLTKLGIWLTGISDKEPNALSILPKEVYDDTVEMDRQYYSTLLQNGVLASEIEQYHILRYRYETLISNFKTGSMVLNKPETILVVSERVKTHEEDAFYCDQSKFEEIEYNNFCDDNLYVSKMRFIFFDIEYENQRKNTKHYFSFLSSILTFAKYDLPDNAVRAERVYKANAVINEDKIIKFYNRYLSKLYSTKKLLLNSIEKHLEDCERQDVSAEEAIEKFESDVTIPVVIQKEYDKKDLMAKYDRLGLSKDCPSDEYHYWYDQIHKISKNFIRYLREPRRALRRAVKNDFRFNNIMSNERAINLNEYQLEDIQYRLEEEERKMVGTETTALFKTKEYTDKIEKADREIRKGISQRMTKKSTLIAGLIAGLTYLFGFLPFLISSSNNFKSFWFSVIVSIIAIVIFLFSGFVFLLVRRKRLINRFKHFNYVMSGILNDIENGLTSFSCYLSHACNVMREFSIFNWLSKDENIKLNIIKKHLRDIDVKIKETEEMFAGDYNYRLNGSEEEQPYTYDFSIARDYSYDIQYDETESIVEFISKGNLVASPIDYVESITLTREELYD